VSGQLDEVKTSPSTHNESGEIIEFIQPMPYLSVAAEYDATRTHCLSRFTVPFSHFRIQQ